MLARIAQELFWLGRDLTRAEWHDLLPNRPYKAVCPQNG